MGGTITVGCVVCCQHLLTELEHFSDQTGEAQIKGRDHFWSNEEVTRLAVRVEIEVKYYIFESVPGWLELKGKGFNLTMMGWIQWENLESRIDERNGIEEIQ